MCDFSKKIRTTVKKKRDEGVFDMCVYVAGVASI
jgi:hypothetical protein